MSDILIGSAVVLLAAALFVAMDALPIFRCSVDQAGVRVRLFGRVPMGHVPLEDISSVEVRSLWELFWDGTLFQAAYTGPNTFRKNVVLFRKTKRPRILGPSDPVGFQQDVLRRRQLARGWSRRAAA